MITYRTNHTIKPTIAPTTTIRPITAEIAMTNAVRQSMGSPRFARVVMRGAIAKEVSKELSKGGLKEDLQEVPKDFQETV